MEPMSCVQAQTLELLMFTPSIGCYQAGVHILRRYCFSFRSREGFFTAPNSIYGGSKYLMLIA